MTACPECGYKPEVSPERLLISTIQREVALHYNIPLLQMTSRRCSREFARPRQVAMFLAWFLTTCSLAEIGRRFLRDHTTVTHARARIEQLREKDADFDAEIQALCHRFETTDELRGVQ